MQSLVLPIFLRFYHSCIMAKIYSNSDSGKFTWEGENIRCFFDFTLSSRMATTSFALAKFSCSQNEKSLL